MGRRPGKVALKPTSIVLKTSSQKFDVGQSETTPNLPISDVEIPKPLEDDAEEDDGTMAAESEQAPAPTTSLVEPVTRKKRLGRPPKNRPSDWDVQDSEAGTVEAPTTPARGRGRGRGGFGRGGGRWARRGGPSHITQQPVDKEGNMMDVINDEVELPEDAEGEKKVDKMGHLQDGREYRCRTFTILGRGQRLYMLSTEPARCVGFRDSYLFFTKHKRLYKIIIDEEEKRDLIERELIPHSYKGRAIGIVTARSVFREFGAQIIVGGRRVIDDYEVARARADGIQEGELADPTDIVKEGEEYNKNQYVAWHGASSVYHSGAPTVPLPAGKVIDGKKKKIMINDVNWMLEHAREASRFNASLGTLRRKTLNGIYDNHTNVMMYPKTMQPSHARWVQIDADDEVMQNSHNNDLAANKEDSCSSIFPPLMPMYSKNMLVVDTVYESAPASLLGIPGPDGDTLDIGFTGLSGVPEEIKSELPPDCRKAFDQALNMEQQWKSRWGSESEHSHRRPPIIDKGVV
ncbi:unnamed protein product [Blumeria hordei]|uniref:Nuclear localization protein NPL6 n=1 Tax=Blumeria hordei TaxID=2867405 RepID=A0A383UVY4_BLUHO|nr:unnamed protein product [Blumeria hordei]